MLSVCPSSVKGACTIEATALPCQPDHLALQAWSLASGWVPLPTHLPRPSWGTGQAGREKRHFLIRGEACLGWRSPAWDGLPLPLTPSLHRARGPARQGLEVSGVALPARRRVPLQLAQSPGVSGAAVTLRECLSAVSRRRGPTRREPQQSPPLGGSGQSGVGVGENWSSEAKGHDGARDCADDPGAAHPQGWPCQGGGALWPGKSFPDV